ncbi:MAG: DUF4112 domain-containing protein [Candidatus Peribacteria bacterium]|nr:MAG: DUF4112 domain-containing protein [Candidatus Peribacteria bacterium]
MIGYQTADRAVGAMPVIGDIADFFFKANRSAYQMFEQKVSELEQYARNHGATQAELDALDSQRDHFIQTFHDMLS